MGLYNRQTGRLGAVRRLQKAALGPWYDSTLAAADQFDVQNIPQGYTELYFKTILRGDVVDTVDSLRVYLNNDQTAANYRRGHILGTGGAISYSEGDDAFAARISAASSPANSFAVLFGQILFYADTNYNSIIVMRAHERQAAGVFDLTQVAVEWESTAAVTRLTLTVDGYSTNKIDTNSRLQIWLYP